MTQNLEWRKSRRSDAGDNCIEVATPSGPGLMAVRDSKDPAVECSLSAAALGGSSSTGSAAASSRVSGTRRCYNERTAATWSVAGTPMGDLRLVTRPR